MQPVYRIENGRIVSRGAKVLGNLNLELRDKSVTAIMGPAGTGKSALLSSLAGRIPGEDWEVEGDWFFRGTRLSFDAQPSGVVWRPQEANGRGRTPSGSREPVRSLFGNGAKVILLDEPTRMMSDDEVADFRTLLRTHTARGAVILITHNIRFAKEVADQIVFICAGGVHASGRARLFFESPPSDLVSQFLRSGSCWPQNQGPPLPNHFHWILPRQLAGMGRPGLFRSIEEDLASLAHAGITHVVSLTEDSLPAAKLREHGLEGRHFPITDMGVPSVGSAATLLAYIERAINRGASVAVHCHAGLGRTGTILASYLAWIGRSPKGAIAEVRAVVPRYIQNRIQEQFVTRLATATSPPQEARSGMEEKGP